MTDMKIFLINPPYQTLTSNLGVGHQVPLGLLMVGGALLDAGHHVELLDAECLRLHTRQILQRVRKSSPKIVMIGHAGSTPAHPACVKLFDAVKSAFPNIVTAYGGVYPTYHAQQILEEHPAIDFIVRGEGEAIAVDLAATLARGGAVENVKSIAFRADDGKVHLTPSRPVIPNLNLYRAAWELIDDWDRYQCFGLGRAAIVQLSRGCPHRCTYCGQHAFWVSWRYRDPVRVADELQWLHDKHRVRFVTLADENPTTLPHVWEQFLREIAQRRLDLHFFATIRASDIVRDEAILPLYRQAGLLYILMGIDTTDARVQHNVRKNSTAALDHRAAQLLRRNGIFAMLAHIVGFEDESWSAYWKALRSLIQYNGDFLNAMYVTPHSWTQFASESASRAIIEPDLGKWDYRHQVLAQPRLNPWEVFLAVKLMELCFHVRPARWRAFFQATSFHKRQLLWCFWHTSLVWLGEIMQFVVKSPFAARRVSLRDFASRKATLVDCKTLAPA
jgi:anaerobic magnesium-protoporphyrin IX monomethyl ester cyclase